MGSYSPQSSNTVQNLNGVWSSNATNAWAVGDGGTISYTSDGTTWTLQNSGTTNRLNAVSGYAGTDVWAVGNNGIILHLQR